MIYLAFGLGDISEKDIEEMYPNIVPTLHKVKTAQTKSGVPEYEQNTKPVFTQLVKRLSKVSET